VDDMIILAIDPGSENSAWVVYEDAEHRTLIVDFGIFNNEDLLLWMLKKEFEVAADFLAIEMVQSFGMPVGKTVFETCVWIGRFIQAWGGENYEKIYRIDVKMHLCKNTRAKDGNIRQAIIDRYPATGGGKTPQIGTKAKPGPLYGVSKDIWAALAVAITAAETMKGE